MCLPHGLRDMCMMRLSAFNEYGSGVIDILIGNICHIGWCIVGRQTIWWEGMLVLNLRIMGGPPVLPKSLPTIAEVGWFIWLRLDGGIRFTLATALVAATITALASIIFFMLIMASIIVAICSFMANMSTFICSCASSTLPITLALARVR